MKVAIVGNREGWTFDEIRKRFLEVLKTCGVTANDTIISGGADGVDTFAQFIAKLFGMKILIIYPKIYERIPDRYFNRNLEIVKEADLIVAFNKAGKQSGTLNTINNAKNLGKKLIIFE